MSPHDLYVEPIMDVSGLWDFLFLLYVLRVLLRSNWKLGVNRGVLIRLVILWAGSILYSGQMRNINGWLLENELCDISVRVID